MGIFNSNTPKFKLVDLLNPPGPKVYAEELARKKSAKSAFVSLVHENNNAPSKFIDLSPKDGLRSIERGHGTPRKV